MIAIKNKTITIISVLIMTSITVLSLYQKQTTVFYIIYLFWFDEFLRTISNYIKYIFKKRQIQNPVNYLANVKSRFFMLFVYFIFIVIIFGLIIDWKNSDLIIQNLSLLFFKNEFFNYCLVTFFLREVYIYKNSTAIYEAKSIASNGIITLHISIILGALIWFFITINNLFVAYENIVSIVPFLIIKFIFEINAEE